MFAQEYPTPYDTSASTGKGEFPGIKYNINTSAPRKDTTQQFSYQSILAYP